jgi:hypothetical protein
MINRTEKILYSLLWIFGLFAIIVIYKANKTLHQSIQSEIKNDETAFFYEKKVFMRRNSFEIEIETVKEVEEHRMVILPKIEKEKIVEKIIKPTLKTKPKSTGFEIKEIPH